MPGYHRFHNHLRHRESWLPDCFEFDYDDDRENNRDDEEDGGRGHSIGEIFETLKLIHQAKIAQIKVKIGLKIAEATGNYDKLTDALANLDDAEEAIFSSDLNVPDRVLARVRKTVEKGVTALTEANEFREAPDFDGAHIDWLIGQNLAVYEDALSKGIATEGGVDYFNLNAGAEGGLTGVNTGFTGGNDVRGTMQAIAANGGTMTIGFELRNFDPNLGGPTVGQDIVAGWWDMYVAGEIPDDDLNAFVRAQSAAGNVQGQTIESFLDILIENGGDLEGIHLRPGYEFDADFNGYTPEEYKKLFKFLAVLLKDEDDGVGLDNVKMVWQSQSGAERSPVDIYDEANGVGAPITEQDVFDHLDLWYPGDEYVDIVGMSLFQTAESADGWMFADGTANDGLPVMDDFDVFLQAFANYARAHDKTLDISESSPAGAYLDRDQFNELVTERLAELGADYEGPLRLLEEGEVAYAKFHTDNDPDSFIPGGLMPETFFDDSNPNFYVSTSAQIWNDYFVPFFQFVERNADIVDSINMISYNWDEVPLFESLITDADPNVALAVNFGSGNWFDNPDIAALINDYVEDTFL